MTQLSSEGVAEWTLAAHWLTEHQGPFCMGLRRHLTRSLLPPGGEQGWRKDDHRGLSVKVEGRCRWAQGMPAEATGGGRGMATPYMWGLGS